MSNSIRTLAQRAKYRLKAISEEENKNQEENQPHKVYGEACLSARVQYALIANQKKIEDDPLYNKIKKLLIKNADAINPLAQIVERNIYDKLDSKQKEKYIYKLSKRYVEIREHILKELDAENNS